MSEIPLTQGLSAIVDDEDFERLSKQKWCYNKGYAVRYGKNIYGKNVTVRMHILLLGRIEGFEIDHINGNGLDNRKINLRHVTHGQNMQNQKPMNGKTSRYKGVSWHKQIKRWTVRIKHRGKRVALGCFGNEEDAAKAYNVAALHLFGENAKLNVLCAKMLEGSV